jgi:hypothetical protein
MSTFHHRSSYSNSCVTRFIASGKKPDVDDLTGKL